MTAKSVLVEAGGYEFFAEVSDRGAGPVSLDGHYDFAGVRDTITAIAEQLGGAWEKVKPSEASVEFGLKLTAKTGKLTGLLVEGGGETSLIVKLTWKADTPTQ